MRSTAIVLGCLFVSSILNVGRAADAAGKPNVLFLICDDLNCDLGCYGHPQVKSPNVDRLAARGLRFENAYCQYPLCGPSRASFMTGLYPDQTLIHRNAIYLREHVPNAQTVAQLFRANGYVATRVGKIFHYNVPNHIGTSGHDDPYSWDFTFNPRGRDRDDEPKIFTLVPGTFGGTLSWLAAEGDDSEQTDAIGAAEAVRLLRLYKSEERPFFLAVGLYRPHTPYVSPKKYFELYPTSEITVPTVPAGYLDTLPAPARRTLTRKKDQVNLDDKLARQAIQAYHAAITFADAQLGRVLDALEQNGLADNTVVVMTSDHGYHMGQHGYYQKTTLFENATHVPLIIAAPGLKSAGQSTKSIAEMVDLLPTLAALCALPPSAQASGVSLVPVLDDPAATARDSALTQLEEGYSLRTPRYRFTQWGPDGSDGMELYDHESDPQELENLANRPEQTRTVQALKTVLAERIEAANRVPEGLEQIRFDNPRRER